MLYHHFAGNKSFFTRGKMVLTKIKEILTPRKEKEKKKPPTSPQPVTPQPVAVAPVPPKAVVVAPPQPVVVAAPVPPKAVADAPIKPKPSSTGSSGDGAPQAALRTIAGSLDTTYGQMMHPPIKLPPDQDFVDNVTMKIINESILPRYEDNTDILATSVYGTLLIETKAASKVPVLQKGEVLSLPSSATAYTVKTQLGKQSYHLITRNGEDIYMKIENIGRNQMKEPSIMRDYKFLSSIKNESTITHRSNFLQLIGTGTYGNRFLYFLTPMLPINLAQLKRLVGPLFNPTAYIHICFQTLQCLHDVHLHHYIHRYVTPMCFMVGGGKNYKTIYITDFSCSYEYTQREINKQKKLDPQRPQTPSRVFKFEFMNYQFLSRRSHSGEAYGRMDDFESWLYCMLWLFCTSLLPWYECETERDLFNFKQRLIYGFYDNIIVSSMREAFVPMFRYIESRDLDGRIRTSAVDYPYVASILEDLAKSFRITGKEPLDWVPDGGGIRVIPYQCTKVASDPKITKPEKKAAKKDDNPFEVSFKANDNRCKKASTTAARGKNRNTEAKRNDDDNPFVSTREPSKRQQRKAEDVKEQKKPEDGLVDLKQLIEDGEDYNHEEGEEQ